MTIGVPDPGDPAEDGTNRKTADDKPYDAAVNPVHDIAAGLFLVALSLFALLWLIPTQTKGVADAYDISPGFFPRIAATAVLILSALFVGHRIIRFRQQRGGSTAPNGRAILLEMAIWTVACAAIWIGLWQIGYLVVAPLIIVAAMIAARVRLWWLVAVMAAATTAATYFGAVLLFEVELP